MRKFSTPKKPIYSTYMYNCKVGGVDESVVEGECVCVWEMLISLSTDLFRDGSEQTGPVLRYILPLESSLEQELINDTQCPPEVGRTVRDVLPAPVSPLDASLSSLDASLRMLLGTSLGLLDSSPSSVIHIMPARLGGHFDDFADETE